MGKPTQAANAVTLALLTGEAQWIIALRLMGMSGLLPAAKGENQRMVTEKLRAYSNSQMAMWRAAAALKPPEAILAAGIAPYRRATRANSRRLTRRALTSRP